MLRRVIAVAYSLILWIGAVIMANSPDTSNAEWWLVGTGIITAAVIAWQSWETRKAAEATREAVELSINKDRARIALHIDPLIVQPVYPNQPPETYITFGFSFHGTTDALNVTAVAGATIDTSPEPNPELDAFRPVRFPPYVSVGTKPRDCTISIIPKQLSRADFDDVKNGVQFVRFFGCVSYKDTFGKQRETRWYLQWKPFMALDGYGKWEPIGPPEGNRET